MTYSKIINIILAICLLVTLLRWNENEQTETEVSPSQKGTIETIHQRKSVRKYTNQNVSKEQLETLVRAGMAAPSAANKQPWAFVIIEDKELLASLGNTLPYAKMTTHAAAAIAVCGDLNKTLDGMAQPYWIQDCSAASQNILLAAEAMDLGAVWTGVYPMEKRVEDVIQILNLPENLIPLNIIPIGYPDGETLPKDKWKPENILWK